MLQPGSAGWQALCSHSRSALVLTELCQNSEKCWVWRKRGVCPRLYFITGGLTQAWSRRASQMHSASDMKHMLAFKSRISYFFTDVIVKYVLFAFIIRGWNRW